MRFDPLLPYEGWTEVGVRIARYANGSSWWLGDWLVFGREKYGRRYRAAVEATGLEYQTLRNYAVVARRFEASRRRDILTFQHHAELCALSDREQDRWLDLALERGWSRNQLRRAVYAARGGGTARSTLRLSCDHTHLNQWHAAAASSGMTFDAWVLRVLDEAANEVNGSVPGLPLLSR